jgi:uncharacterized protein YndB with AHSA1/START domain
VISSHQDTEALTMTVVAEFDADVDRVWRVREDPRQLERWWGPPASEEGPRLAMGQIDTLLSSDRYTAHRFTSQ